MNKSKNLVSVFLSLFLLILVTPVFGQTMNGTVDLDPIWATGIISDGAGRAGIIAQDVNDDGVTDIVACGGESVYLLNHDGADNYHIMHYSQPLSCSTLAVGDRDGDDIDEIYVGGREKIYILSVNDFSILEEISIPDNGPVNGIDIGDVDGDGQMELVFALSSATYVFSATTLTLEWEALGKGGTDLQIGNIDADDLLEIVVNAYPAHILNAKNQIEEWSYSSGFGIEMAVGDVDGDNIDEIAFIEDWDDAYLLDGVSQSIVWHLENLSDLNAITIGDLTGDDFAEVLIGDGQWGNVTAYNGIDGAYINSIRNPEVGVFGIATADTDNDGTIEVLWGATGHDILAIGNLNTSVVEWQTPNLDGPLFVAYDDVDLDGQLEFIMASRETDNGQGGTLQVFDAITKRLEWSATLESSFYEIYEIDIGQLDSDPQLEIVIAGNNWYDTRMSVYDGVSGSLEWESSELADDEPKDLIVVNLDSDPIDEIIIGLSNGEVQIFNGASDIMEWTSGPLDNEILDITIGDTNGDSIADLVILTRNSIYIFDGSTGNQLHQHSIDDGLKVAVADAPYRSSGVILVGERSGPHFSATESVLSAFNANDFSLLWQQTITMASYHEMTLDDFDSDGNSELLIAGSVSDFGWPFDDHYGIQILDSSDNFSTIDTIYQDSNGQNLSPYALVSGAVTIDINNDSINEILFASLNQITLFDITLTETPPTSVTMSDYAVLGNANLSATEIIMILTSLLLSTIVLIHVPKNRQK